MRLGYVGMRVTQRAFVVRSSRKVIDCCVYSFHMTLRDKLLERPSFVNAQCTVGLRSSTECKHRRMKAMRMSDGLNWRQSHAERQKGDV